MTGDGRFVYTSGSSGGDGVAITVLRRSPSGTVAMSSCVAEWDDPDPTVPSPDPHCAVGYPAADDPDRIAISADGRFTYTASADRSVVSVLRRDARTGRLRPYQSAAGCVSSDGTAVDRLAFGDAPGRGAAALAMGSAQPETSC